MSDISFEFVEQSTVKVTEKCYIAMLMVPEAECSAFGESELYRKYNSFNAVAGDFEATTETYKMCNVWFKKTNKPIWIAKKSAETYTDSLTALYNKYNWFGFVMITSTVKADILEVANWCETYHKILWALSTEKDDTKDSTKSTDIASSLMAQKYRYAGVSLAVAPANGTNYLNVVSLADTIGKRPGSYDICDKGRDWVGVTPDDYSDNEQDAIADKNCNFYYIDRNTGVARSNYHYGVMANGDSLFQRRNIMWFNDEIMTRMWNLKFSQNVILRTADTMELVKNALNTLFEEAKNMNVCMKASKSLFAKKLGISEDEVENYFNAGYIMHLPDITDDANWESDGKGRYKYKNIVFDVIVNGVINQFEGTIILRKM